MLLKIRIVLMLLVLVLAGLAAGLMFTDLEFFTALSASLLFALIGFGLGWVFLWRKQGSSWQGMAGLLTAGAVLCGLLVKASDAFL